MSLIPKSHFFSHLQGDYAAWLSQVLISVVYEDLENRRSILPPQLLRDASEVSVPVRICDSQRVLHDLANVILNAKGRPAKDIAINFLIMYENFQSSLQRLEQDCLLADFGIDSMTGLRSSVVMVQDLERELERRSRRGQAFCMVLSKIDGINDRISDKNILLASQAIEETMRGFDDAYVVGQGEFLISLKHADEMGGIRFIERLKNILVANSAIQFTMSSCVVEPVPGDDIKGLISSLQKDLGALDKAGPGVYTIHKDVSRLSQYIQELEEKK
jgi:GGDEF domain-containing protein